jgi:hypothetical protein
LIPGIAAIKERRLKRRTIDGVDDRARRTGLGGRNRAMATIFRRHGLVMRRGLAGGRRETKPGDRGYRRDQA